MSASETAAAASTRASCPTCKAVFRGDFRRCSNDGAPLTIGGPDPLVGTVLAERYQIEQVIGDGGLGRVYRARHVRMSRRYAIKVPFGDVGYDRKSRARLSNEAEAASRLDHPNVIGVVDVGETREGLFYMAMDLAAGQSLADVLGEGPLVVQMALEFLAQICSGLAHAHDRGLIHRDLKPDNIVVSATADGDPLIQIIDFGLALLTEREGSRLTTEGLVVGTPYYMAPEQSTDEPLDHHTDLFALGIILYEMLAGSLPFDGGPTAVARQNLALELPTVFERSGRPIDPLLDGLIGWMTRKRAADRPDSARVVGEIARLVLAGDRVVARERLPEALRPALLAPTVPHPAPAARDPGGTARVPSGEGLIQLIDDDEGTPGAASGADERVVPSARVLVPDETAPPVPRPAPTTEQVPRNPMRRYGVVALVGLGLGTLITLGVRVVSQSDRRLAAIPVDASPAPIALALDAAPPPLALAPDAAADLPRRDAAVDERIVVRPSERDAGAAAVRPPAVRDAGARVEPDAEPRRSVDAGVAEVAAPVAPSLKELYQQVPAALNAAVERHGLDRTASLRQRFDRIPSWSDAQRKPEVRAQAEQELRALARELARLGP